MNFGSWKFDLGTMVIFCVLILLAVLAANGRLQNVINAFNGSTMPQPASAGSSWASNVLQGVGA